MNVTKSEMQLRNYFSNLILERLKEFNGDTMPDSIDEKWLAEQVESMIVSKNLEKGDTQWTESIEMAKQPVLN